MEKGKSEHKGKGQSPMIGCVVVLPCSGTQLFLLEIKQAPRVIEMIQFPKQIG